MSNLFKCFIKQGNYSSWISEHERCHMYNEIKTQSVNSFTFQLKLLFENRWGSNWIDDSIIDQNNHVNSEISGILTAML